MSIFEDAMNVALKFKEKTSSPEPGWREEEGKYVLELPTNISDKGQADGLAFLLNTALGMLDITAAQVAGEKLPRSRAAETFSIAAIPPDDQTFDISRNDGGTMSATLKLIATEEADFPERSVVAKLAAMVGSISSNKLQSNPKFPDKVTVRLTDDNAWIQDLFPVMGVNVDETILNLSGSDRYMVLDSTRGREGEVISWLGLDEQGGKREPGGPS